MPPSKPDLLHCFMDQKFSSLPDVQSLADGRNIPIDRVGVRDLTVPLTIASISGPQPTIAEVSMYVGLPADKKGTHRNRLPARSPGGEGAAGVGAPAVEPPEAKRRKIRYGVRLRSSEVCRRHRARHRQAAQCRAARSGLSHRGRELRIDSQSFGLRTNRARQALGLNFTGASSTGLLRSSLVSWRLSFFTAPPCQNF